MTSRQAASDDLLRQAQDSYKQEQQNNAKTKQVVEEGFTSFGASYEVDDYINSRMRWMASYKDFGGHPYPRYGLMSLCVAQTPVIPYDCPALNKISLTGFTDGIRVFVHTDFVEKGRRQEEESKGEYVFMVPFVMHEFTHKIRRHAGPRHAHWDPVLANIAQDRSINAMISLAWPEMKWAPALTETGIGFAPGEKERDATDSEETIYFRLQKQLKKGLKQPKPPGGGGGGESGQGGGGSSGGQSQGGGGGMPSDEDEQYAPDPTTSNDAAETGYPKGRGKPNEQFGGEGDFHTISPEELIKILEDAGMDESMRRLGLPSSQDKEAIEQQKARAEMGQVNAINEALDQMRDAERRGLKYPGAGMVLNAAETISSLAAPKMTFKLAFRDAFFQNGQKDVYHEDDEPDEIYHVDSVTKMLGDPLYMGIFTQERPASAVLVVIDASGSVGTEEFKEMIAEIYGLKKAANNFSDTATEVIIVMGATELATGIQMLDEDNWEAQVAAGQKLNRLCTGGTNLHRLVNQALELPEMERLEVQSLILFTDSYDGAPKMSKMNFKGKLPTLVCAVSSSTGEGDVEKFARDLGNEGRVVRIDEGVHVDLTEDYLDTMDASPQAQKRRRRTP